MATSPGEQPGEPPPDDHPVIVNYAATLLGRARIAPRSISRPAVARLVDGDNTVTRLASYIKAELREPEETQT